MKNRTSAAALFPRFANLALAVCLLLQGCASAPRSPDRKNAAVESASISTPESEIGRQINQQILASFYVYTEPTLNAYVDGVMKTVSGHAERRDLSYQIAILYNDKIYATGAPGGYLYVTTGMMQFLDNEAELAAVLAQEIAQLQPRDPSLSEARKKLQQVSQAGAMVSSAFGSIGALAALGFVAMNAAATPRRHASLEKRAMQADKRALHYLLESGYDPQALIDFTDKFLRAESSKMPFFYDYVQARPLTQPRLQTLRDDFSALPVQSEKLTTGYQRYQDAMRGIQDLARS